MKKAVIFDMDGVIINSETFWNELEEELMRDYVPTYDFKNGNPLAGYSIYDISNILVTDLGANCTKDEILNRFISKANILYGEKAHPIYQSIDFAERLHSHGYSIGLASCALRPWVKIVSNRLKLERFFDAFVSCDDVENAKPSPDVYSRAASLLNIQSSHCIAIEDSSNGVLSAINAGMQCIGLAPNNSIHADKLKKSGAIMIFEDCSNISVDTFDRIINNKIQKN